MKKKTRGYKAEVVEGRTYYVSPTGFKTPHLWKMLNHVAKHLPEVVPAAKPEPVPEPPSEPQKDELVSIVETPEENVGGN